MSRAGQMYRQSRMCSGVYDPVPDVVMDCLEQVIRFVWIAARENQEDLGTDFDVASETEISSALVRTFDRLKAGPVAKGKLFRIFHELGDLQTGGPIENFEGTHLDLRPDFNFRLKTERSVGIEARHHAIFVEAKVISPTRTIADYCQDGVHRFVRGDYAWRMQQAILLAYARHPTSGFLPNSLSTWLAADSAGKDVCKTAGAPVARPLKKIKDPAYCTSHGRPWAYVQSNEEIAQGIAVLHPGPIELRHIWLQVSPRKRR